MIDLNDVLLAMSNIPVDDPIAEIWGRGLQGGYKIIEYTGSLPITINANGDALLDYRIYGADGGVGETTENLWDNYFANGTYEPGGFRPNSFHICGVEKIPIKSGTQYSISYVSTYPYPIDRQYLYEFDTQGERLRQRAFNDKSFTTSSDAAFCTISVGSTTAGIKPDDISDFMLVEGSTAPANYIPYGYKLPMTVAPKNLFDKNATDVDKGYVPNKVFDVDGSLGNSSLYSISEYMQVEPLKEYFLENFHNPAWTRAYGCACFYDSNKNVLSVINASDAYSLILLAPESARFIRISVYFPTCKFYNSAPQKENVYIGENQLEEDEYVSFSDQKIYRNVSGTLTPTDPPVPFPEIPTIDGETVIDYDGEPKPSQMYIKYKGKG